MIRHQVYLNIFAYISEYDNIHTKNTETFDSSKEVVLEVNVEKTKYMLVSRHQNAGQNQDIKINKQII
jgi:hypothetical protein